MAWKWKLLLVACMRASEERDLVAAGEGASAIPEMIGVGLLNEVIVACDRGLTALFGRNSSLQRMQILRS